MAQLMQKRKSKGHWCGRMAKKHQVWRYNVQPDEDGKCPYCGKELGDEGEISKNKKIAKDT